VKQNSKPPLGIEPSPPLYKGGMLAVITIEAVAAELGIEPKNPGFKDRSRTPTPYPRN
jgi:hypothetical protein